MAASAPGEPPAGAPSANAHSVRGTEDRPPGRGGARGRANENGENTGTESTDHKHTGLENTGRENTASRSTPGKSKGFPREARLRGRSLAGHIFKTGRYHGLGQLQAKTLPRPGGGGSRFLISIRKSVGNAPLRNRIKRVVREAIRLNRERLLGSHDICLFMTRRPGLPVRLGTVEPEILHLFARLSAAGKNARDDG